VRSLGVGRERWGPHWHFVLAGGSWLGTDAVMAEKACLFLSEDEVPASAVSEMLERDVQFGTYAPPVVGVQTVRKGVQALGGPFPGLTR
jgi:hypothetical protein